MEYDIYTILISVNFLFTFIIILAACLCCKKRIPKNEFLGLEGMVKIKNPEENNENLQQIETKSNSSTAGDIDIKRASNAPHRSLPDIPVIESLNDNGSELYATVADKVHEKPQGRSPTQSLKKQTSVSQHSSISQADDVSSPYARVKTPPHNYDRVLSTEHPYAQLNAPIQNNLSHSNFEDTENNQVSRRGSNQNLLDQSEPQQEIPAASAIAGMISASQELPYMTPPIVQQPHFSGDSQDSSKGYTSISVREPLANILAQTNRPQNRLLTRDHNDPHYATVSDDSDEMYAAIEDPNNVYTSGSETYAQIQPSNPITVSVEINTTCSRIHEQAEMSRFHEAPKPKPSNDTPIPPPVDSLRAQMHSRQASSSSNTSSVGVLGSPKPEKRQANSPLPPTPKNAQFVSNSNLTSSSSIPSGRNSVASVIECQLPIIMSSIQSKDGIAMEIEDNLSGNKNFSPSKDIEGMYAKVMKKNKFPNVPSQNSSPIMGKKLSIETNSQDLNAVQAEINMKEYVLNAIQASPGKNSIKSASYLDNSYETIDKRRPRSNSYDNKDHGYETIPGDQNNINNNVAISRKSDGYAQILQKENLKEEDYHIPVRSINFDISKPVEIFVSNVPSNNISSEPGYESLPDQSQNTNDPGYETLLKTATVVIKQPNSDYDPNYEVLRPAVYSGSDDGYGYSRVKERKFPNNIDTTQNHDYEKIRNLQVKNLNNNNNNNNNNLNEAEDFHNYQTICDIKSTAILPATPSSHFSASSLKLEYEKLTPSTDQSSTDKFNSIKCSSTSDTLSSSMNQNSNNYESLTGSESDPNYESVRYLNSENPYERLQNISPETIDSNTIKLDTANTKNTTGTNNLIQNNQVNFVNKIIPLKENNGDVTDYYQV